MASLRRVSHLPKLLFNRELEVLKPTHSTSRLWTLVIVSDILTDTLSFLKMMLTSSSGGQLINYSDRFTLTGMTGTFPANVLAGINAISGTTGPANEDQITNDAGAGAGDSGNAVPYSLQSGLTRYAPMQPVPPTKITAKTWTPLFPTSAFTVATTYFPRPSIVTTITASQTFSVSSVENTVSIT